MGGFSARGFDPAGFEPVELDWPAARAYLATVFAATADLDGWTVYAEPPEQLAGGRCVVIAPRSPYRTFETFARGATHLSIHVLVPRTGGPAMDALDAGLAGVIEALLALSDVSIDDVVNVGILDETGGVSYLTTTINVTHE